MNEDLPISVTREVRHRCLCLYLQRSARAIGRLFDDALRPFNLTNGQFSLLMSLNRPEAPKIGDVANLLAMDRTTLTANLKPLERRGLLTISPDPADKRSRRLHLTLAGEEVLIAALPTWRSTHDEVDQMAGGADMDELRTVLERLSHPE